MRQSSFAIILRCFLLRLIAVVAVSLTSAAAAAQGSGAEQQNGRKASGGAVSLRSGVAARPDEARTRRAEAVVRQAEAQSARGETARSLLALNRFIESFGRGGATHRDSLLLTRALRTNASNYESLGNNRQALTLLQRALAIAKATGDEHQLAVLYNNIFAIYYSRHEYGQAEDLLLMSLQLSLRLGDSTSVRNNYNNFGLVCYERAEYSRALQYMDKALAYAPKGDAVGKSLIFTNRAEVYTRRGMTAMAERELQKALDLQRGHNDDYRTLQSRLNMAYLKAMAGRRREAVALQRHIYADLPHMPLSMQVNAYEQMADVNFALGDSLAALRDIMRYMPLNDSLQRASNNSQLQQLLVAYDADRLKQHNTNLRQTVDIYRLKAEGRTKFLAVTVAFLIVLALLLVALLRRMKADRQKSRLISSQQRQLLAYEQQAHQREQEENRRRQQELTRRQQELSLEIDHKNRQLTSHTLDLAAMNEFHQHISATLTALREKGLKGDEADATLKELIFSLQHFNDKPLGDDFRVYFDEVHPGFLMRLSRQFALSKSDLRLCAYLHLGMTTKEIAALTFKEVRSVESSRNRLRKKLGLPPESNLQQFLEKFAVGGERPDTAVAPPSAVTENA